MVYAAIADLVEQMIVVVTLIHKKNTTAAEFALNKFSTENTMAKQLKIHVSLSCTFTFNCVIKTSCSENLFNANSATVALLFYP